MNINEYKNIVNKNFNGVSQKILLEQINNFISAEDYVLPTHKYKIGDSVFLKKGTLLHGTYKNIEGLKKIVENGLLSDLLVDGRNSKFHNCVGVWNLKQNYYLNDYINFYSGGTILFKGENYKETKVISYDEMSNINEIVKGNKHHMWVLEQTKEARFMPSLAQNRVQIGIIFSSENDIVKELLKGDILNPNFLSDEEVKPFINEWYYDRFINERNNKDDFFTDRESAILFGIPSCLIEGILVGRTYEKDEDILSEIKKMLPNAYICNLEGKIIKE